MLRGIYAIKALRFSTALSVLKDEFLRSRDYPRCPPTSHLFHRFRQLGYACIRWLNYVLHVGCIHLWPSVLFFNYFRVFCFKQPLQTWKIYGCNSAIIRMVFLVLAFYFVLFFLSSRAIIYLISLVRAFI